jgi:hypothetical protein
MVVVPVTRMAPPLSKAWLLLMVVPFTTRLPPTVIAPPRSSCDTLPLKVPPLSVILPVASRPPPSSCAVLAIKLTFVNVRSAWVKSPPPKLVVAVTVPLWIVRYCRVGCAPVCTHITPPLPLASVPPWSVRLLMSVPLVTALVTVIVRLPASARRMVVLWLAPTRLTVLLSVKLVI